MAEFLCQTNPVHQIVESPLWLLLKNRPKDAEKSLRWLRGWRSSSEAVAKEFAELKEYSELSLSCMTCAKQSLKCNHTNSTFWDSIKELARKRSLKPFILIVSLQFFLEFSMIMVWMPFIIPVLKAYGIPFGANLTTVILSTIGLFAHISLLLTVKTLGKRIICLNSMAIVVLCCIALSKTFEKTTFQLKKTHLFHFLLGVYGFIFFPPGWSSFKQHSHAESMTELGEIHMKVGRYGYLALICIAMMQFFTKMGISGASLLLVAEVFPLK